MVLSFESALLSILLAYSASCQNLEYAEDTLVGASSRRITRDLRTCLFCQRVSCGDLGFSRPSARKALGSSSKAPATSRHQFDLLASPFT